MRSFVAALLVAVACLSPAKAAILSPDPGGSRRGRMTEQKHTLADRLRRATDGLVYQSESDAPVEPFLITGFAEPELTPAALLAFTKRDPSTPVATVSFDDFFADLVALEDWYGDEERDTAKRYRRLVRLLESALSDLEVYKVGERSLDVYVVGKTPAGEFAGVTTKAVET
jgi:hypothetical protein